ncbi:response regulator transcription factor [Marinagarivorans algicola]|nr:response regulator transcription factor [Marinagarivorans algicola]
MRAQRLIDLFNVQGYSVEVKPLQSIDNSTSFTRLLDSFELVLIELKAPNIKLLKMVRLITDKPLIVLGVGESHCERIECLQLGVDDCIASPYSPIEVELRVKAILKRSLHGVVGRVNSYETCKSLIAEAGMSLDPQTQTINIGSEELVVTQVEFKLLWLLVLYKGRILSKPYTYQRVLGREYGAFDRAIDMHLSRVRKKLSTIGFAADRIKTVRGQGYAFC